jgi:hypothetical protein
MNKQTMAIARGVGVISATVALMAGVTFAQFSSSATLTANTVSTATPGLEVSTDNVNYGTSETGLTFDNLLPGVPSAPQNFYLYNNSTGGSFSLAAQASAIVSPTLNPSLVTVTITDVPDSTPYTATLAQWESGFSISGPALANGAVRTFTMTVTVDPSVSTQGSVSGFNWVFTGTQP